MTDELIPPNIQPEPTRVKEASPFVDKDGFPLTNIEDVMASFDVESKAPQAPLTPTPPIIEKAITKKEKPKPTYYVGSIPLKLENGLFSGPWQSTEIEPGPIDVKIRVVNAATEKLTNYDIGMHQVLLIGSINGRKIIATEPEFTDLYVPTFEEEEELLHSNDHVKLFEMRRTEFDMLCQRIPALLPALRANPALAALHIDTSNIIICVP